MLNCTYSHSPSLALPLGELSPQATERVLGQRVPSPSSLCSATSPRGRGKEGPHAWQLRYTLSVFASLRHLSQRERQVRRRERKFLLSFCQLARERSKKTEGVFLVGSRRSGGKSKSLRAPNRKPAQRLRFGKEEMSTEDKRRRSRRLVPSWSFLTRCVFFWRSKRKCWTAVANL